jgi:hypothetical protein
MADKRGIKESNASTTVILPRQLRAEVQDYAEKDGRTMGALIRKLLADYVAAQKAQQVETA